MLKTETLAANYYYPISTHSSIFLFLFLFDSYYPISTHYSIFLFLFLFLFDSYYPISTHSSTGNQEERNVQPIRNQKRGNTDYVWSEFWKRPVKLKAG
jgi:hypothetical protein